MTFSLIATALAILFCIGRAVVDFGQRRYLWAAAGILCAALLLTIPIETHAVKFDLPQAANG